MITKQDLADGYALNLRLIELQTDGLSHADSLIQTPYRINCMNWVLGHIAVNRDRVLILLGEPPLLTEAQTARYQRGSEPVQGEGEDIIPLERLLDALRLGQERINERLSQVSDEELARELEIGEHTTTIGARLHGLYFHDTYHTGQTDLLRQVAGKSDQVIP